MCSAHITLTISSRAHRTYVHHYNNNPAKWSDDPTLHNSMATLYILCWRNLGWSKGWWIYTTPAALIVKSKLATYFMPVGYNHHPTIFSVGSIVGDRICYRQNVRSPLHLHPFSLFVYLKSVCAVETHKSGRRGRISLFLDVRDGWLRLRCSFVVIETKALATSPSATVSCPRSPSFMRRLYNWLWRIVATIRTKPGPARTLCIYFTVHASWMFGMFGVVCVSESKTLFPYSTHWLIM